MRFKFTLFLSYVLYSRKEDCSSLVDAEELIVRHLEEKASAATEEEDKSQATEEQLGIFQLLDRLEEVTNVLISR